ncbi:MAG TPA: gluconate 2-dehydrogenase subunit 3 family protein [Terriglobia bacterium]|nr:gluconate 2-dehydrogenase subunit 3 family protein [Terriglobia bacterium]
MSDQELEQNSRDGLEGEISRREWLMKLGQAAFVFGFSGTAAEQHAKAATVLSALAADLQALPPGLYEPSSEHMAHALTNDERYVKTPAGSETDYVQPRRGPFRPAFFSDLEFQAIQRLVKLTLGPRPKGAVESSDAELEQTIAEIAEWIDLVVSQAASVREAAHQISPQHRALAVAYYGKEAVEKVETDDPERVCRDGLKWLDDRSTQFRGTPFLKLGEVEQIEIARSAVNTPSPPDQGSAGRKLFSYLSSQTVVGLYTSRLGLKELGYRGNSFSAECPGCKPS